MLRKIRRVETYTTPSHPLSTYMDRFSPSHPCRLCGGTKGTGSEGAHELCKARKTRGMTTPSLGEHCPTCKDSGLIDNAKNPTLPSPGFFNPYEFERYCNARWTPCPDCGVS